MSDDREKLKALLLSEEIAQIEALNKLLNDKNQFSQKVSEVLDSASDLAISRDSGFQKKFSKIDPKTFVKAIRVNKQTFIDALLPIIGPMIRKSVSSSIRKFVADVNRALELGISAKALKWRWKALRTGVPFAEIVFNNTIEYQVEQVFLIDNNSGLLIEHAGHEESLLQDKEAMSAMLTVIQDFVKDSVSKDGGNLSAAELGDNLVWIIPGNKANIAAVIKGAPSHILRDEIAAALEEIHDEYQQQLENQDTWNNCPELNAELEGLLLTKSQSNDEQKPKKTKVWPWLLVIFIPLIWFAWVSYQKHSKHKEISQILTDTSGFVLTDLSHENGSFIATGFKDPLTQFAGLDDNVIINSTPFISLDDDIVALRISNLLNDPNVEVSAENSHVTIRGAVINSDEFKQKLNLISLISGINQVTDLTTQQATLSTFLKNNPPPDHIRIEETTEGINILGVTTAERLQTYKDKLAQFGAVDTSQVDVIDVENLIQFISANPLLFINTRQISESKANELSAIADSFIQINRMNKSAKIKLTAQSDCQGSIDESNENNQSRLKLAESFLINKGLNNDKILTHIIACTQTMNEIDPSKIGIWFEVLE